MSSFAHRVFVAYKIVGTRFGAWAAPMGSLALFVVLRMVVWIGQTADVLLYREVSTKTVTKPIIIVGNPRTGSTFVHRFLDENGFGVGQQVIHQLYPSVVLQRLLRPCLPLLERISPTRHHSPEVHETSLSSIETDDVSILFRHFDGFFLYGFILANAEEDLLSWFDGHRKTTTERDFDWFRKIWVRNMVSRNHPRILVKSFSMGADLLSVQQAFPDSRVLYLARDPVESIPSGMSLITGVLDNRFGFFSLPEADQRRFCHRLKDALLELLRRFVHDWEADILRRETIKIVSYERLITDFDRLMVEISDFVDHPMDEALRSRVEQQAVAQQNYRSRHRYSASTFFLDEDQLRGEADFFYTFLKENQ